MRRKAIESGEIEQALQTALPLTATESVKDLALLLAAAANGEIPLEDAQRQLAQNPIFQHILRTLGDQTVRLTNSLLAFGENSQTGDVSIKDMAGNDIISLTINISHTTQASSISTNRLVLALILSSLIVAISFIFTDVLMQNRTSLSSNSNISTPTAPKNTTEPTAQISDTSISSPNSVSFVTNTTVSNPTSPIAPTPESIPTPTFTATYEPTSTSMIESSPVIPTPTITITQASASREQFSIVQTFSEDFLQGNKLDWEPYGTYSDRFGTYTNIIENGEFFFDVTITYHEPAISWSCTNAVKDIANYRVTFRAKQINGNKTNGYGLLLDFQDESGFYLFQIREDQFYYFARVIDGNVEHPLLVEPTFTSAINTKLPNIVTIIKSGNEYTFIINGIEVNKITTEDHVSGQFCLANDVDPASTNSFEYYSVIIDEIR